MNRIEKAVALVKGDLPGHPFHGNQYSGGDEAEDAQGKAEMASRRAGKMARDFAYEQASVQAGVASSLHLTAVTNARLAGNTQAMNHHQAQAQKMKTLMERNQRLARLSKPASIYRIETAVALVKGK